MSELRIERPERVDAFRDEWSELAARSRNVFATWEWAATWWRHFGTRVDPRVTICRNADGAAAAILPLQLGRSGPIRILRFVGHGPSDELGPVCAPADRAAAARALRRVLDEGGFDIFLGDTLPDAEPWAALLGGRVLERTESPLLHLESRSWDDFLANRSQNLRQQVKRFERRLERSHELRFRLSVDPDLLQRDLDTLFALHRKRWHGSRWFTGAEDFHRDFAAVALERGWLRLWLLELAGVPVAAWLGFRFGGVESYYQAGRDPAWERWSVGFVLLAHTIRQALQDGMTEYRFLRGGEQYKYRFATADPGLVTIARPNGALGNAALAARGIRRRLRALVG
jgi:CelD/BcsL family acetyltransferase involved in cellulose biosynthesis